MGEVFVLLSLHAGPGPRHEHRGQGGAHVSNSVLVLMVQQEIRQNSHLHGIYVTAGEISHKQMSK